jgi:UDP-glucose-4-epimerase GalE
MRIIVTGGAGYIGSHMVKTLQRAGHPVLVIDDLCTGHADAIPKDVPFAQVDIADRARVTEAMRNHRAEAVVHFAARIQVGESVSNPRLYFTGNLGASIALLESALDCGVSHFILSSTAAVYGQPEHVPIDESHPTSPVNPYGETKLGIEKMLAAYGAAYGLKYAALRYFNAAGADPGGTLAERHVPESHLIPIVLEAAAGKRGAVTVYGTDYDTPDGTCIRDYIHVNDLCEAHLATLEYLARGGASGAFNLGTGVGHSVKEVITTAERVSGRTVPVVYGPRRPGDPARLVAAVARAEKLLGWRAKRPSLDDIIADAWRVL